MLSPEMKKELITLVKKYQQGKATPAEIAFIEQYYQAFESEAGVLPVMSGEEREQLEANILQRIEDGIELREQTPVVPIHRRKIFRIAAAAVIFMILSAGTYLYLIRTLPVDTAGGDVAKNTWQQDRQPGKDGAILTLADVSVIVLDSVQNGALTTQGATRVVKQSNGQLEYVTGSVSNGDNAPVALNTLSTPRGRQFQVTLPDGSRAWLNAASSVRYPTAFVTKERKVEVTGEVYFEVAKDASRPFLVTVKDKDLTVSVLGTHFNINAYEDESTILTTLIEGAVSVSSGQSIVKLSPGQQAQAAGSSKKIQVSQVDTDQMVAWKNGNFEFNGNIRGIMRQIARWYDVDIQYTGNVTDNALGGAISRSENISQVLKMLQMTGSIQCTLEGRVVTVSP